MTEAASSRTRQRGRVYRRPETCVCVGVVGAGGGVFFEPGEWRSLLRSNFTLCVKVGIVAPFLSHRKRSATALAFRRVVSGFLEHHMRGDIALYFNLSIAVINTHE